MQPTLAPLRSASALRAALRAAADGERYVLSTSPEASHPSVVAVE